MPDVTVANHGSIFTFTPHSEAAREWITDNVDDDAPWWAGALAVEPRYARDLAAGMQAAGLEVA
jgi:hypothetical protein